MNVTYKCPHTFGHKVNSCSFSIAFPQCDLSGTFQASEGNCYVDLVIDICSDDGSEVDIALFQGHNQESETAGDDK